MVACTKLPAGDCSFAALKTVTEPVRADSLVGADGAPKSSLDGRTPVLQSRSCIGHCRAGGTAPPCLRVHTGSCTECHKLARHKASV